MTYQLFYSPAACSLAPHIALQEAGLNYEAIAVDLRAKTCSLGDYRAINAQGCMPALRLPNGELLTESAVILQYIANQAPQKNLIPQFNTLDYHRCQEWLNYIATELHKGFSPLWNPATPAEYKTTALNALSTRFDYLNHTLTNKIFLLDSGYSIADAYLFTVINWSHFLKIDLAKWPHLQRYLAGIQERPTTRAAMKAEGLS